MTSKEKQKENLYEWISGIFGRISNGYPLQRSGWILWGGIELYLHKFIGVK
jgi:hypothetical protein